VLNVQYIDDGTVRFRLAGALGHGFRKEAFNLIQVIELGSDIFEMTSGDLVNLSTRRPSWSAKPDQHTNFLKRKPQFARASNETQRAEMRRIVDSVSARRARWGWQHLGPLVKTDRLGVDATQT
jgi:hypothetical protein